MNSCQQKYKTSRRVLGAICVMLGFAVSFPVTGSSSWGNTPVAATAPATDTSKASDTAPVTAGGDDLRSLIGVNPGLKRAEIPQIPAMSLRGFIQPHDRLPQALLEITELNRVFLVQEGTEIPITVAGRVSPVGRDELTGLGVAKPAGGNTGPDAQGQSQIILTVVRITGEGVTVKAGLLAQTIIIR